MIAISMTYEKRYWDIFGIDPKLKIIEQHMKVSAYRCDYCGVITKEDDIVGIIDIKDLFEVLKSFPTHQNAAKCNVHHCVDCSSKYVLIPASYRAPRKNDERAYQLVFNELYYLFKSKCVDNFRNKVKIFSK